MDDGRKILNYYKDLGLDGSVFYKDATDLQIVIQQAFVRKITDVQKLLTKDELPEEKRKKLSDIAARVTIAHLELTKMDLREYNNKLFIQAAKFEKGESKRNQALQLFKAAQKFVLSVDDGNAANKLSDLFKRYLDRLAENNSKEKNRFWEKLHPGEPYCGDNLFVILEIKNFCHQAEKVDAEKLEGKEKKLLSLGIAWQLEKIKKQEPLFLVREMEPVAYLLKECLEKHPCLGQEETREILGVWAEHIRGWDTLIEKEGNQKVRGAERKKLEIHVHACANGKVQALQEEASFIWAEFAEEASFGNGAQKANPPMYGR